MAKDISLAMALKDILGRNDLIYPEAPRFWQDGFILGNGDVGAIAYAPQHLEWTVNKTDVFDGRIGFKGEFQKDRKVREHLRESGARNLSFLNELEPYTGPQALTKSCGIVKLRFGDEYCWKSVRPHHIEQRLSLAEAVCHMKLDMHASHPRVRSFVAADRNLLTIRLENAGGANWRWRTELVQPFDAEWASPAVWGGEDGMIWFTQEMPHGGARYALVLTAAPGTDAAADELMNKMVSPRYRVKESRLGNAGQFGDRAWLEIQGNADVFAALATSYESEDPLAEARRLAAAARNEGLERLEERHRRWWSGFWARSRIELPDDPEVERDWYFSLYQTGCLLRRAPVPGLYGLWYGHTDSARIGIVAAEYTENQNVQMPVMPVFAVNHPELADAFMDTHLSFLPDLRRFTREVYERPGACIPWGMNQLGQAHKGGSLRYCLVGGAYSGLLFVWAYRFTRDEELLRLRVYPFLSEITRFYVSWMEKMDDGRYRLDLSVPSEIQTLAHNEISTLVLFKPCLELAIEASRRLAVDDEDRRQWEEVLAHYPALPTRDGMWVNGAEIELHHWTQGAYLLYPVFPGNDTSPHTLATTALTLERLAERDIELSYADETGRRHCRRAWSHFFHTMALLRLGRPEDAWDMMLDALRLFRKPNGLFAHNPVIAIPPEITERNILSIPKGEVRQAGGEPLPLSELHWWDDPSGVTMHSLAKRLAVPVSEGSAAWLMMVTESLLQSHGRLIRLFPGLPKGKRAMFENLRAEGGVLVGAERDAETVQWVRLEATAPVTLNLLNPWRGTEERRIIVRRGGHESVMALPEEWEIVFERTGDALDLRLPR